MVRHDNPNKKLVDLLWDTLKEHYNKQFMESGIIER
jgi:hypothetical protein